MSELSQYKDCDPATITHIHMFLHLMCVQSCCGLIYRGTNKRVALDATNR